MIIQDTRDIHTHINTVNGATTISERDEVRRVVTLTNEDITLPEQMKEKYGRQSKFVPRTVRLVYRQKEHYLTGHVTFDLDLAYTSGPSLKKDGTPGTRDVENKYYLGDKEMPEWLRHYAEFFSPTGTAHPFPERPAQVNV